MARLWRLFREAAVAVPGVVALSRMRPWPMRQRLQCERTMPQGLKAALRGGACERAPDSQWRLNWMRWVRVCWPDEQPAGRGAGVLSQGVRVGRQMPGDAQAQYHFGAALVGAGARTAEAIAPLHNGRVQAEGRALKRSWCWGSALSATHHDVRRRCEHLRSLRWQYRGNGSDTGGRCVRAGDWRCRPAVMRRMRGRCLCLQ